VSLRLRVAANTTLPALMDKDVNLMERAVTRAASGAGRRLLELLRATTRAALKKGRGVANAWRLRVYPDPKRQASLSPAALLRTKTPEIITAFDRGEVIRALGARYMVIPTGFNLIGGRRRKADRYGAAQRYAHLRVTPQQMMATQMSFTRPVPGKPGRLLWCLPVFERTSLTAKGRTRRQAMAVGLLAVGTRVAERKRLLARGWVPMFILAETVKQPKYWDLEAHANAGLAFLALALERNVRLEQTQGVLPNDDA
jgi:hypothetical protein